MIEGLPKLFQVCFDITVISLAVSSWSLVAKPLIKVGTYFRLLERLAMWFTMWFTMYTPLALTFRHLSALPTRGARQLTFRFWSVWMMKTSLLLDSVNRLFRAWLALNHRCVLLEINESLIFVNQGLKIHGSFCCFTSNPGKKPWSSVGLGMTLKATHKHQALELIDVHIFEVQIFAWTIHLPCVANDVLCFRFY